MPQEAMITGNQLEALVALVLGIDAVVVAGIVISRLTHRRSNRQETASSVAVLDASYAARSDTSGPAAGIAAPAPEIAAPAPEIGARAATAAVSEAPPPVAEFATVFTDAPHTHTPGADAPVTDAEADYAAFAELAPPPLESNGSSVEELLLAPEAIEALEPPEAREAPVPAPPPGPSPVGLDFGPTWVDPLEMAAAAAAEWRHALRRDLARAAHRGRSAMVMHLKLDIEKRPDLSIQEVARIEGRLLETLNALVRPGDYVDRTGPGRFHMILSEMPEAGAVAVAERVKHVFAGDVPDSPRLLIGWAAMETEADIALALQRAAERVDDSRSDSGEGPLGR
jgi:GGDEF domain-containing protein